jgi:hypothetical protein
MPVKTGIHFVMGSTGKMDSRVRENDKAIKGQHPQAQSLRVLFYLFSLVERKRLGAYTVAGVLGFS